MCYAGWCCLLPAHAFFLCAIFCYDEVYMLSILFEDDEILVVDKPSGLPAQPGEGVKDDVVGVVERQLGYKPFPVHRLDRDTAGCMMLAKTRDAAAQWSQLIASRDIVKLYYAWAAGGLHKKNGVIDVVLDGRKGAQEARTLWRLKEQWVFQHQPLSGASELETAMPLTVSLLELELKTGRMHQIRRHLAAMGLPILGDDRHGDFSLNKALRRLGVRRLMLWAYMLVLPGGTVVRASMPPHFAAFRETLKRNGAAQQAV